MNHKKKVMCIETEVVYDSILAASIALGVSQVSIGKVANKKSGLKTVGGYTFEFVEMNEKLQNKIKLTMFKKNSTINCKTLKVNLNGMIMNFDNSDLNYTYNTLDDCLSLEIKGGE